MITFRRLILGAAALAASAPAGAQTAIGLEDFRLVFDSDVRILAMGDSFCSWTGAYNRIFPAVLMVWPIEEWTAIAGPTHPWRSIFVRTELLVGGAPENGPIEVGAGNSYRVENQGPTAKYFGLPIRSIQEHYTSPAITLGPGDEFIDARITNSAFALGENGRFTNEGDEIRYRLTYLAPTDPLAQYGPLVLQDDTSGASAISIDLASGSRKLWHKGEVPDGTGVPARSGQINAAAQDLPVSLNMDGTPRVRVMDGDDAAAAANAGRYFDPASHVFYHVEPSTGERKPGLYYTVLADASWTYQGFGAGAPSTGNKQFSLENLTHWLDVTTLDRDQPLRVFYLMDTETGGKAAIKARMEGAIAQTKAGAETVGIVDVKHCLVIPHFHLIGGTSTIAFARTAFEESRDAAFEIAAADPNVAAASIYDATDQIYFDGSQEARDWLIANGYGTFTYGDITADLAGPNGWNGDLLDSSRLHPRNNDSAAFFAHILGRLIAESTPCTADCDQSTGPGMLDVFDFLCFQDRFIQGHPYACDCDTATGAAVCDIFDFLCFQDAFAAGCP